MTGLSPVDKLLVAAQAYTARDWAVLLLATDSTRGKIPPRNCARCDHRIPGYVHHDPAACDCLLCHGFYAATRDIERVRAMLDRLPDGYLAVRTGTRSGGGSGLVVIDAEGHDRANVGMTGVQALGMWNTLTGVKLPDTLRAQTVSGGVHLWYRLPDDTPSITSGRVIPNVDVKGEHGYVGAPCGRDGRRWVNPATEPALAPPDLIGWLADTKRIVVGSGGGGNVTGDDYDYERFRRDGCPNGQRERFFRDMSFNLRKAGWDKTAAEEEIKKHWERCDQPPENYMPWHHVQYKVERDWARLAPDVSEGAARWAANVTALHPRRAQRIQRAAAERAGPAVLRRGRSGFGIDVNDDARGGTQ